MKSKLVYLSKFSGEKASVYSIITEDRKGSFFNHFVEEYNEEYFQDVLSIISTLREIGLNGAKAGYFKMDEGLEYDDLVCALYDIPDRSLRLYCIRLFDKIVIVGNGGPKNVRAWQDDPKISREVHEMMHYSKIIRTKLNNGCLQFSTDGKKFEGNLLLTS